MRCTIFKDCNILASNQQAPLSSTANYNCNYIENIPKLKHRTSFEHHSYSILDSITVTVCHCCVYTMNGLAHSNCLILSYAYTANLLKHYNCNSEPLA